jgi:hypothetical protein
MRSFTLALMTLLSLSTYGQKVALLDRKFKQPIVFTDSLTVEQVKTAYLPIPVKDFDTLDANLKYLEQMLSKAQRAKMGGFELRAGNTSIAVSRVPMAYADRYRITLRSESNGITSLYTISDANSPNSKALDKIKELRTYIRRNNSLFTAPNEIHPKIYNVVVISD